MQAPLQTQPYTSVLGTHEGLGPLVISELFSPEGSVNVFIDRMARIKRIDGYDNANSSAVTTDTGASATVGVGLAPRVVAAGTRTWVAAWSDLTNELELWVSTDDGATWTFKNEVATSLVAEHAPVFAQFGDDLYSTYAATTPRKYTSTTISAVSVTQSPTPTATGTSSNGGLLSGNYKYKLVSVEPGNRKNGSAASTVETVSNGTIALSWTADADTDVTGYEVYRTTGTGEVYYFVGWVEGRTTVAFTDTNSDLTILEKRSLEEHGDAPPSVPFCVTHGDRMWWLGGVTSNRARGYWSNLARPESVGAFSYLEFTDPAETHQIITGAAGNFNKKLAVFTRTNIWTVSGTGAVIGALTDWTKRRTNATAGTIHHNTIARVPPGAIWRDEAGTAHRTEAPALAYLTPNRDIRLFDGDSDAIISHPVKTALSVLDTDFAHMPPHAFHDEERGHIVWTYADTSDSNVPSQAVVWSYRYGTWYLWDTQPFGASAYCDTGNSPAVTAPVRLAVTSDISGAPGLAFNLFTGNTFDGDDINAAWMTGTIYGRLGEDTSGRESPLPAFSYTKRLRWVDLMLLPVSGVTLNVEAFAAHTPSSGSAFVTKTVTPSTTSLSTNIRRVLLHDSSGTYLHDIGFRLRVSNTASTGAWAVEGLMVGYQNLPGLKRRSQ